MFSYFGGKSRLVDLYRPPEHGLIIEPFCGSARYACKYGIENSVWINDKFGTITDIWLWIQQATKKDIQSLPVLKVGERLSDFKQLSGPEKYLLGFSINPGSTSPRDVTTARSVGGGKQTHRVVLLKRNLLTLVGKIDHWKITNLDYRKVKTPHLATWFIDAPYQFRRSNYEATVLSYKELGDWVLSKRGQIIVCEKSSANWLPFEYLATQAGQGGESVQEEVVYYG
jgi:hypothetical protein